MLDETYAFFVQDESNDVTIWRRLSDAFREKSHIDARKPSMSRLAVPVEAQQQDKTRLRRDIFGLDVTRTVNRVDGVDVK